MKKHLQRSLLFESNLIKCQVTRYYTRIVYIRLYIKIIIILWSADYRWKIRRYYYYVKHIILLS